MKQSLVRTDRLAQTLRGLGGKRSLRLTESAKPVFTSIMNEAMQTALQCIVDRGLPKITRGAHKGEFRTVTFTPKDLQSAAVRCGFRKPEKKEPPVFGG